MADIGIAISMSKLLLGSRKHSLSRSRSVINVIITVEEPFLGPRSTSYPQQVVVLPGTMVFFGICFIMGKLYVNSLLTVLNDREALRAQLSVITVSEYV
ncbi:hypothetical protein NEOLEDRAFT_318108 [Neolentinus lepideus HHB14362 ss-1]|uniref:DUF6534 domain-containing protein n=1 Tax=Neolentinus lepideus HHB14362 ss-1 TaxID=1314782 RepID=A0A165VUI1_9AGAM|nr:hypothetical protein NEOLEDRAFT_318108 [Neolentinus lepideus HHB14362 ss-1]